VRDDSLEVAPGRRVAAVLPASDRPALHPDARAKHVFAAPLDCLDARSPEA